MCEIFSFLLHLLHQKKISSRYLLFWSFPEPENHLINCNVFGVICMMLVQCQDVFIKFCIFLSELGALGLLFLVLNLTTTWVIHLNVAVKIRERVHEWRYSFRAILYQMTSDALGQWVKEHNISDTLILGTKDTLSTVYWRCFKYWLQAK